MSSTITALTSGGGLAMAGDTSGQLELKTNNGTTAVTINTSQQVGVGATPSTVLNTVFNSVQVGPAASLWGRNDGNNYTYLNANAYYDGTVKYITTDYASRYLQALGTHQWFYAPSGTAGNAITFTEAMRIDSSGNVMIGTTSNNNRQFFVSGGTTGNYLAQLNNTTANPIGLWVGYTAAAPNGTTNNFLYCEDNSTVRVRFASNGGLYNYSANNSNLSDQREKKNIELAGNYLDKICAIPVKTFLFNDQTDTDLNLGVIAQDVQAIAPELVSETNWGTEEESKMRLSIYQTDLQYALMKAIQELNAKVDAQAAEIQALKGVA